MCSLRHAGVAGCVGALAFLTVLTVMAVMSGPVMAGPPTLALEAPCPGGGTLRASWTQCTPRGLIGILWARGDRGGLVIPQNFACAGTQTGLGRHNAQAVYIGPAGPDGSGSIGRVVGPNACNGYMQAIDLTDCLLSATVKVQP